MYRRKLDETEIRLLDGICKCFSFERLNSLQTVSAYRFLVVLFLIVLRGMMTRCEMHNYFSMTTLGMRKTNR